MVAEDVRASGEADGEPVTARFDVRLPTPRPWSPEQPDLYTVRVRLLADGDADVTPSDERTVRVGLRTIAADGARLLLNGAPVYPRMILSWGWYPDVLYANPGRDRVRADLLELRRLGFNGVKLCLWFPPDYYFDLADELGMLVWVELPMWLPHPTEHFRGQLDTEAERLVRAARTHPSVVLYTLGCELSAVIGDDVLGPLYAKVKDLAAVRSSGTTAAPVRRTADCSPSTPTSTTTTSTASCSTSGRRWNTSRPGGGSPSPGCSGSSATSTPSVTCAGWTRPARGRGGSATTRRSTPRAPAGSTTPSCTSPGCARTASGTGETSSRRSPANRRCCTAR